jgi:hypothetical protein
MWVSGSGGKQTHPVSSRRSFRGAFYSLSVRIGAVRHNHGRWRRLQLWVRQYCSNELHDCGLGYELLNNTRIPNIQSADRQAGTSTEVRFQDYALPLKILNNNQKATFTVGKS